jgi:hypothetical protein
MTKNLELAIIYINIGFSVVNYMFVFMRYTLLSLLCLGMCMSCDNSTQHSRKEVHSINQKITPNSAEQVNMTHILAGLKNKGFDCKAFNNAVKKPMVFCSRPKNKDVNACSDSIWLEHDGQNHVLSNQQFYECDNQHKMVITRKN